jgi:hypothetical protein
LLWLQQHTNCLQWLAETDAVLHAKLATMTPEWLHPQKSGCGSHQLKLAGAAGLLLGVVWQKLIYRYQEAQLAKSVEPYLRIILNFE